MELFVLKFFVSLAIIICFQATHIESLSKERKWIRLPIPIPSPRTTTTTTTTTLAPAMCDIVQTGQCISNCQGGFCLAGSADEGPCHANPPTPTGCTPVPSTPTCMCPAVAACPTIMGCTTSSGGTCDPTSMMCDGQGNPGPENCFWPTTNCFKDPTNTDPDCLCSN